MDMSKVKDYLRENGFEKGKLGHLSQLIEEVIQHEVSYKVRPIQDAFNLELSKVEQLRNQLAKKEEEIEELKEKLSSPSEAFQEMFLKCAREYLSVEDIRKPYDGRDEPVYGLLIDGEVNY